MPPVVMPAMPPAEGKPRAEAKELRVIRHRRQPYPESVAEQEAWVDRMLAGLAPPAIILTEHPPTYTIGTSGSVRDILQREVNGVPIEVHATGRGGEVTYHGPGQLVIYVIADIRAERDLHRHVWRLEEMVIRTLAEFGIAAGRSPRGIGVWVGAKAEGGKIAAVGVRCRKWITFHGIALNIAPDLAHFRGIVPCGMRDAPVASMRSMGVETTRADVEDALIPHARELFGATP